MVVDEPSMSSGNGTFVAFVSGALLGAVAGILLAPQSGRETRERLRGYARDNFGDMATRAKDSMEQVRDKGRQLADKGREFVKSQAETVGDAVKAGREAMQSERDRLASGPKSL